MIISRVFFILIINWGVVMPTFMLFIINVANNGIIRNLKFVPLRKASV
jgi:hypothetical protein